MFRYTDFELSDLQLWRKLLLATCIVLWLFLGIKLFNQEADIYVSAPKSPVEPTGQLYAVHVNHGAVRYVTTKEFESLAFWRHVAPTTIGISALAFLFAIGTYRKTRR